MTARLEMMVEKRARQLRGKLTRREDLNALFSRLNNVGGFMLFGGIVRDACFGLRLDESTDIDIVVSGNLERAHLSEISWQWSRTNLGGYRYKIGSYLVDVWKLEDSAALKHRQHVSVMELLDTVVFSTDACAYNFVERRLLTTPNFQKVLSDRLLDFVTAPKFEVITAVRAFRLLARLNLAPSEQVLEYCEEATRAFGIETIVQAEEKWKGHRVLEPDLIPRLLQTQPRT